MVIRILVILISCLFLCPCQHLSAEEVNPYDIVPVKPELKELTAELQKLTCRIPAGELESRLRLALKLIVEQHPNPAVRELNRLIAENRMFLLFSSEYLSGLKELSAETMPANTKDGKKRDYYLVLTFDPDLLLCSESESDVREIMIALDHEMFHYRQWLAAWPDTEVFRIYKYLKNVKIPLKLCRQFWQNEFAAYRRTCVLIDTWDNKSLMPTDNFCLYDSDREFEDKLYLHLLKNSNVSIGCKEVWREDIDK